MIEKTDKKQEAMLQDWAKDMLELKRIMLETCSAVWQGKDITTNKYADRLCDGEWLAGKCLAKMKLNGINHDDAMEIMRYCIWHDVDDIKITDLKCLDWQ